MIPLYETDLEREFRQLGHDIHLALSTRPLKLERLSKTEREQLASFSFRARRIEWLTGRAALRRLRCRIDPGFEVVTRAPPDSACSLTHSAGIAVAAAAHRTDWQRVGVDLELARCPDPRAAKWFLTGEEQRRWERTGSGTLPLLRIWTAKEALYKADPHNTGRVLADYALADPSRPVGRAFAAHCNSAFRYASLRVPGGYLSIASHD